MWTTFALAALSLAPAQAGGLELTNVRPTYGMLGAPRPDLKFLPGDEFFLAFEIDGIKADDSGNVLYAMPMEVTDAKGKVHFKVEKGQDKVAAINFLGGAKMPAVARVEIGLDMPAGEYTLKVGVTDLNTKKTGEVTRKFEVLPAGFGVVRLNASYDDSGAVPAPMTAVVGQLLSVNFLVVGFERDKSKKQPSLTMEMRILDEAGKPTLAKPFVGEVPNKQVPEVPAGHKALPQQFGMALNRAGKFTVEIKVTDNVTKKFATTRFPLVALANDPKAK